MPWAVSFACGYLRTKNDHGQTTMPGVSHKSKHMPGKERYQSRMRLHGQRFPERSEKENPEPAPERVPPDELAGGCAGGARRGSERTLVEGRRGCPRRIQEKGTPSRPQVRGARRRMPFVDGDDGAPWRDLGLGVLGCSSSALIRSVTILVGGERMGGRRRSRWTAEMDGVAVRVATRTVVGTGGRAVVDLGSGGRVGRREDGDGHHNRRRPPVVAVIAAGRKSPASSAARGRPRPAAAWRGSVINVISGLE